MSTKSKIITTCVFYALVAFLLCLEHSWSALAWATTAFAMSIVVIRQDACIEQCIIQLEKNRITIHNKNKMLTRALGKAEAYLANCKRYQDQLKKLRGNDKNTNRRTAKKGNQRDAEA